MQSACMPPKLFIKVVTSGEYILKYVCYGLLCWVYHKKIGRLVQRNLNLPLEKFVLISYKNESKPLKWLLPYQV